MPHRIGLPDLPAAQAACGAILLMYVDLVRGHGGFGYGVNTGTQGPTPWEPARYVDCEAAAGSSGDALGVDLDLLHEGSAVALLCGLFDVVAEGGDLARDRPAVAAFAARAAGRLAHLPLADEAVARAETGDEGAFSAALRPVYEAYVLGYFRRLVGAR